MIDIINMNASATVSNFALSSRWIPRIYITSKRL